MSSPKSSSRNQNHKPFSIRRTQRSHSKQFSTSHFTITSHATLQNAGKHENRPNRTDVKYARSVPGFLLAELGPRRRRIPLSVRRSKTITDYYLTNEKLHSPTLFPPTRLPWNSSRDQTEIICQTNSQQFLRLPLSFVFFAEYLRFLNQFRIRSTVTPSIASSSIIINGIGCSDSTTASISFSFASAMSW